MLKISALVMAAFLSQLSAVVPVSSVVSHDETYFSAKVRNTELIYTRSMLPFANDAAAIEQYLQPLYENIYGYCMDETLFVGLASPYNQIANGFSTPYPNNRQINYPGGVLQTDYFASPSWLKTLIYHETAHNYQMNAKDNPVSTGLHSVIRNGAFFIPWFTLPNITESSFLLEGNAVLNESWHGNGGRLYSGRFKAATLQQAKAGYLTPERVYNDNYDFLYGSHFYTLGGYYQSYLAEHYGLRNVNAYWKIHSREWAWPFFTNMATKKSVGVDFETAFDAWRTELEAEAATMHDVEGKALASSQFYSPINSDRDTVYFIVNPTGRTFPELVVYRKNDATVTTTRGSFIAGKVLKLPDGHYATQGSAYISPWRIYEGLYDEHAEIVKGTESKIVEGYLHDGTPVYFNVPASFEQPQLYVGGRFYARANSSVFIDNDDNLYYFVQGKAKQRTLYRNKTPLFSIKGYYGNVSGVDSRGAIYFIANTSRGSGLFRFKDGRITRAHAADTIIEARLIDDDSALVAVMGSDAYTYKKIALASIDETPYEVKLFVENKSYYQPDGASAQPGSKSKIDLKHPYHSFLAMNYSGTDFSFGSDSNAGFLYNLNINFADPLTQNALAFSLHRGTDEYTLGGISYANNQSFLHFAVSAYGVIEHPETAPGSDNAPRDYGIIVRTALPFLRRGRDSAALRVNYYQDYESGTREPLSAALDLTRSEQYGVSMYRNLLVYVSPYVSYDRGDTLYGGEAAFEYGLPYEYYFSLGGQYSSSDAASADDARGVKVASSSIVKYQDGDPSTVIMPSLRNTVYFKSVFKGSVGLKKTLNLSAYFFTFPVSLRREALFATYNRYDLEAFGESNAKQGVNEADAGIVFDTLWMNRLPVPITLRYLYNDDGQLADRNTFRFEFGLAF